MAQEKLAFLSTLIETIPGPIFYKNNLGMYLGCNKAYETWLGKPRDQIIGKTAHDFAPKELADKYKRMDRELLEQGGNQIYESTVRCNDGTDHAVLFYKAAYPDVDGKPAGLIGFILDITERKRIEEALRASEEKYRGIFEGASEGIFQTTPDGSYLSINPSFAGIFGYDSPEEMSATITDIGTQLYANPEDRTRLKSVLDQYGHAEKTEVQAYRKDKTIIWVSINARVVKNTDGTIRFYEGTINDITESKLAHELLLESEKQFRTAIEHSNDGVAIVKGNAHVYVNRKFLEIFGYEQPEDIIGKPPTFILHPDEKTRVSEYNRLRQAGLPAPNRYEIKALHSNGSIIYAEVSAAKTTFSGQPATLAFFRDITERKTANLELLDHKQILEKKNRELETAYSELKYMQSQILQQEKMASIGQLAAGVAHEINNPVGFIMSNLNSLSKYVQRLSEFTRLTLEGLERMKDSNGDGRPILSKILEQKANLKIDFILADLTNLIAESLEGTERVKRIVQDLKSFARVDHAENALADINEGMDTAINIVWNELKYKADLIKEYGDIPLTRCNLSQLNQVFMNLLLNGVQAIKDHGKIRIKTWCDGRHINVLISDTGCGIPENHFRRVFEPFFTTKPVGQGTGLGLSIAYDIVSKHKGIIDVEAGAEKGTTFTIRIPIEV